MAMRRWSLACVAAAFLTATSLAWADNMTWDVPWWTGADGNAYTDADGNKWSVYELMDGNAVTAADAYLNFSNYYLMEWDASKNRWEGEASEAARTRSMPFFRTTGTVLNLNLGSVYTGAAGQGNWRLSPALVFEPGVTGHYCWKGTLRATADNDGNTNVHFGVITAAGSWVALHDVLMANQSSIDLGAIESLQNISLGAGDRLAMTMDTASYGRNSYLWLWDNADAKVGITLVPEPSSLVMVLFGWTAIRKLRRA